ncbi:hypothetical protein FGO68_gene6897 [Halteria grandinella]|uniref:Uncharacterized protein n=1 Tax=Halteria grandinella TaxID=5974 RepID=A0A8J8NFI3_HALGN|nr:hypothetical protein FGO68_gene6897 [Halteria grandinella]
MLSKRNSSVYKHGNLNGKISTDIYLSNVLNAEEIGSNGSSSQESRYLSTRNGGRPHQKSEFQSKLSQYKEESLQMVLDRSVETTAQLLKNNGMLVQDQSTLLSKQQSQESLDLGDSRRTSFSDFYELNEMVVDEHGKQIPKNFRGKQKVLAQNLTKGEIKKKIEAKQRIEFTTHTQVDDIIKHRYQVGRDQVSKVSQKILAFKEIKHPLAEKLTKRRDTSGSLKRQTQSNAPDNMHSMRILLKKVKRNLLIGEQQSLSKTIQQFNPTSLERNTIIESSPSKCLYKTYQYDFDENEKLTYQTLQVKMGSRLSQRKQSSIHEYETPKFQDPPDIVSQNYTLLPTDKLIQGMQLEKHKIRLSTKKQKLYSQSTQETQRAVVKPKPQNVTQPKMVEAWDFEEMQLLLKTLREQILKKRYKDFHKDLNALKNLKQIIYEDPLLGQSSFGSALLSKEQRQAFGKILKPIQLRVLQD